jgi:trk system potassium uptake protein
MNIKIILRVIGFLMLVEGAAMLPALAVSLIYNENDTMGFLLSSGINLLAGALIIFLTQNINKNLGRPEGFISVTLIWIIFPLLGSLPYIFTGAIPVYTDAFFESMSGFSTTGSTIINNIEALPHGILFWRSLTQWLGGMGMIIFSLAVLPVYGIGGMQLYIAEVQGLTPDKIIPRIKQTATAMWLIYLILTVAETVLLWIGKMPVFDAICHSFTTISTGGFSTKQANIAFWPSAYLQYIFIFFMFLAGTNFALTNLAIRGKIKAIIKNEEFKYYVLIIIGFTVIIFTGLLITSKTGVEEAFRNSLFQVVSVITTTGFSSVNYLLWKPILLVLLFSAFFVGSSVGSTGGGIKIMRIALLFKNGFYEVKKIVHPNAVIPVKFNNHNIESKVATNILAFFILYFLIFGIGTVFFMLFEPDLHTSMGAVATSLGNIGPGLGSVGPGETFAHIHPAGKWFLSFLMLLGRLELFTILVLFNPSFWRR